MLAIETGQVPTPDNHPLDYTLYLPHTAFTKSVILAVHGGCFVDGDHTWNSEQSKALTEKGHAVLQLNFRKDNPMNTLEDILYAKTFLENRLPQFRDRIGIFGSSSGGFYALKLVEHFKFCILACPVFNPYKRYCYLQKSQHPQKDSMLQKHLQHFGSKESMQLWSDFYFPKTVPTFLIGGLKDQNMPIELLKPLEKNENTTVCYLDYDHGLCHKNVPELISEIDRYIGRTF